MKKKLILVAAPPACGKTYVSELIARSVGHIVYLDKDDLADLVRRSFELCGESLNMDGEFYSKNLRPYEYSTILHIAFSTLRFEELVLIWVTAPLDVCYERMKKRNSDRDTLKLENWDEYVKKIDYTAPTKLIDDEAVDRLIVFDTANDDTFAASLEKTLEIIRE